MTLYESHIFSNLMAHSREEPNSGVRMIVITHD
jgi:hypothetical protein